MINRDRMIRHIERLASTWQMLGLLLLAEELQLNTSLVVTVTVKTMRNGKPAGSTKWTFGSTKHTPFEEFYYNVDSVEDMNVAGRQYFDLGCAVTAERMARKRMCIPDTYAGANYHTRTVH